MTKVLNKPAPPSPPSGRLIKQGHDPVKTADSGYYDKKRMQERRSNEWSEKRSTAK